MKKTIWNKLMAALLCAFGILALSASSVRAERVDKDGVSYDNEDEISVGYAYNFSYGGVTGGYTQVYLRNAYDGDSIVNVKSSSPNLLTKITRKSKTIRTDSDGSKEESYSGFYCIGYFAKKPGKYTVSFDVMEGKTNTKKGTYTITVTAGGSTNDSAIKSAKYAGKEIWEHAPYAVKKSGKLSIKLKKGYSLLGIEVIKCDQTGKWAATAVKNNKKIKLAASEKYTKTSKYSSWSSVEKRNELFPETRIRATVKNNKTGEVFKEYVGSLFTFNKK